METWSFLFLLFSVNNFIVFPSNAEGRYGLYQRVTSFEGLSLEYQEVSKVLCSARCLQETRRGIHFEAGTCKLLFDTNDVPQNERTKYSQVALGGDIELFINVQHKCSSVNPCRHGGVCGAVDGIYQCNCTGTDHYGPLCETGGNPWTAPDVWHTLYPQVNLNLDDHTPYFMRNGATNVTTPNGYGFRTVGGYQFVDLGDWSNETCFVDVDNCQEGFTLMTYVNIGYAAGDKFRGYISSMAFGNDRYGAALYGYHGHLWFEVMTNLTNLKGYQQQATGITTFPTGWINVMVIFKANDGIQIFVDNVLQEGQEPILDVNRSTALTSGHIVLGRYLANVDNVSFANGELLRLADDLGPTTDK